MDVGLRELWDSEYQVWAGEMEHRSSWGKDYIGNAGEQADLSMFFEVLANFVRGTLSR